MRNQSGFASLLLILLLPFLLGLVTALFVFIGWTEGRREPLYQCRKEALVGLESFALTLEALLELNPKAQALRKELGMTLKKLAAASGSGNFPAAAAASAKATRIRARQAALDRLQRSLLQKGRGHLTAIDRKVQIAVVSSGHFFVKNRNFKILSSRFAVRPDSLTLAPIYELEEPFLRKQALAYEWQGSFRLSGPLANFLSADGETREVCAATLFREGNRWRSRLIEDKF